MNYLRRFASSSIMVCSTFFGKANAAITADTRTATVTRAIIAKRHNRMKGSKISLTHKFITNCIIVS